MIAVDTNILVYAHREETRQHRQALARLRELAEGDRQWAVPVFCLGEFVRVVTHPGVFTPPSTLKDATAALEALCASPGLTVLSPGERYWALLRDALLEAQATGNLAFDAQIVAVCREFGVATLVSEDRDFRRFHDFALEHLS
ncbi:MAG TPA: TA system VapC family ribonuclease toxin [Gemmatimonadales bacterium]|nr:TA system VapC family ribonuclease toxin [Gemmatimonadales bacterium]